MLTLKKEVLGQTFEHLRSCGAGRDECVAIWTGPIDRPGYIDDVVVPRHTASPTRYDIEPSWIGEFWLELAERKHTARCQVHTHPGNAYHSARDDQLALVHTSGYCSLVLPRFATGPIGLEQSFLAVRDASGHWLDVDAATAIEVES